METAKIIELASEVSKVLNNILSRLPTYDQKKMEEFFKFLDYYETEVKKDQADFDKLVLLRQRKNLLIDTIVKGLKK